MSKQVQDAYIVAAARTPIGKSGRGYFRNTRSDDLLIRAIQAALAQVPTLDPAAIEDAIVGCSFPEGEQGMNMARIAVALAGLPSSVGGITVNRFCASGLSAIQMAADRIRVGEADVMIAGGAESMSLVPMGGNKPSFNPAVFAKDENVGIAYGMGLTAEKVATQWKVSREDQDAFALASHQKALKAMAAGEFANEICAVDVIERVPNLETGEITLNTRSVSLDEGARPDTSLEGLAKLRPVFAAKGSVTAGNSSQTSDGAGGLDPGQQQGGAAVRPDAAGALRQLCQPRCAARDHGHRPDRRHPGRAGLRRPEAGRHGLDRAERGVCRAVLGRDPRPGVEPRARQPDGWRHRAGPSAGRHRRHPRRHGGPRAATPPAEVRHGHHVRGHGAGRGWHLRARVTPMNASRRAFVASAGALSLGGCQMGDIHPFATIEQAVAALQALPLAGARATGAWTLPQVLVHLAQSVEFSIAGFPEMKSAIFRATLGRAAFAVFDARGAMSHPLDQPIPGAPALAGEQDLPAARLRLVAAMQAFQSHTGASATAFRLWRAGPRSVCSRPPDAPGPALERDPAGHR